jgi:hypothetical protein
VAITKLHFTQGSSGALSSGGSFQLTIPATTAGSLLVLDIGLTLTNQGGNTTVPLVVTDSAGSTYTAACSPLSSLSGSSVNELAQYYSFNVAAGVTSVKVTLNGAFGGSAFPTLGVWEFAGAATTNPVDVTVSGFNPAFTAPSLSLTTTVDGDVLIFATLASESTPTAGFTLGLSGGPTDEFMIQGTHGSTTCSFSGAPSGSFPMCFTAFKAGASAAATATHFLSCCGCGG